MKRSFHLLIVLLFVIVGLGGCMSSGKKVEKSDMDKIVPNQTTRAEVISLLGQPSAQMQFPSKQAYADFLYQRTGKRPNLDTPEGVYAFYQYQHLQTTFMPTVFIAGVGKQQTVSNYVVLFCNDIVIGCDFKSKSEMGL